jgi:hypothetical protein
VRPRPLPPIVADTVAQVPSLLPPTAAGPYAGDGTFTFDALNVYANAPVDADIVSAPPVGSAATIRFFIDHQRSSTGSFPAQDWPILLGEKAVSPAGAVLESLAPANVPLFEQLRSSAGTVPIASPVGMPKAPPIANPISTRFKLPDIASTMTPEDVRIAPLSTTPTGEGNNPCECVTRTATSHAAQRTSATASGSRTRAPRPMSEPLNASPLRRGASAARGAATLAVVRQR